MSNVYRKSEIPKNLQHYFCPVEMGLEQSPAEYIAGMVAVFRDVRRVLRDDGTLWLNIGDSYHDKQLQMIPARLAIALQEDGWILRSSIIWHKPNPMPESVCDRPMSAHEHIFLLTKSAKYWYDADAVSEATNYPTRAEALPSGFYSVGSGRNDSSVYLSGGFPTGARRNLRNVWTIATRGYAGAHFATYPPALVEPCIKAGCPAGGTVLDPFLGSGTTLMVVNRLGRNGVGIELNPDYARLAEERITGDCPMFTELETA